MKFITPTIVILATLLGVVASLTPEQYFDNGVYGKWLEERQSKYNSTFFMNTSDESMGVGLFWTIDRTAEEIQLAVVCPTGNGWCGFGIAEAGGMLGSDMVIFESQTKELYDAYVLDDAAGGPIRDTCQNWELINSVISGDEVDGVVLFEAKRSLNTGDSFDRILIDDSDAIIPPTRVIAAWSDTPTVSFHGTNVARASIRFFRTGAEVDDETFFRLSMKEEAEGGFDLRAINYSIPAVETMYAHFCFTYADLIALGLPNNTDLHTIGIEPIVDENAKEFVHHFILSASLDPYKNYSSPIDLDVCDELPINEVAYSWAPGEGPLILPSNVGGPLGTNGYKTFKLQTHYDNPSLKTGVVDSSGVRFYWTTKKRELDLGILQLGDPIIALFDQMVGTGLTQHTFDCPSSCTEASLTQPVTVFREYMHMHKVGSRMFNEQIRDGEVVHTGAIDFWEFDQSGDFAIQQESFQILPGDSFRTRCYHSAEDQVWGLASAEEMCIAFLYYYPRQVIDVGSGDPFPYTCGAGLAGIFDECNSAYANVTVRSTEELERFFGGDSGGVCNVITDDDGKNGTDDNNNATGGAADDKKDDSSSTSLKSYSRVLFGFVLFASLALV